MTMKNESKVSSHSPGNTPASKPVDRRRSLKVIDSLAIFLLCGGVASAQGNSPTQLRQFIDERVGGIQKLMVPEEANLPQPLLANGTPDPRFRTTEAKRFLGKMLFFDPVRTARILPQFGGILSPQSRPAPAAPATLARSRRGPA